MSNHLLTVTFHDYWHIGTGRGGGPGVDARVRRSPSGLPIVPGRTLKGVLRDAVTIGRELGWHTVNPEDLFGTSLDGPNGCASESTDIEETIEAIRFKTRAGLITVDNARLGQTSEEQRSWESAATDPKQRGGFLPGLFGELSQTKLKDGVAVDHSLRTIEVVVPLTLHAPLSLSNDSTDGVTAEQAYRALKNSLPLINNIGHAKRRGLGRVHLTLSEAR